MNIFEVNTKIDALADALAEKEFEAPSASIEIFSHGKDVEIWLRYTSRGKSNLEVAQGETPEKAFAAADKFVADLEDVTTVAQKEFLKGLGRLIDQGRACDVEMDFLNPLTETMKKLSENILTDQRV